MIIIETQKSLLSFIFEVVGLSMKLAIFGDSFASLIFGENPSLSWVELLAQNYDVKNFAVPGTDLYFSAEHFLKEHYNFDKIIFVITSPGRIMLPERSWIFDNDKGEFIKCLTARTAEEFQLKYTYGNENKVLKAASDYYLHIENYEYVNYVYTLIINDLKEKNKEALFLDISLLLKVMEKENCFYKLDKDFIHKYEDFRNCHLTKENNFILFEIINKWINTGNFEFNIDLFVNPVDEFSFYFRKK